MRGNGGIGETRAWGLVTLAAAELWIVFWASSLAYMVQGVRRSPEYDTIMMAVLVLEVLVLMPLGWLACLHGSPVSLRIASWSALALLLVALTVGVTTLDLHPHWGITGAVTSVLVFAAPAALLGWGLRRVRREHAAGHRSVHLPQPWDADT